MCCANAKQHEKGTGTKDNDCNGAWTLEWIVGSRGDGNIQRGRLCNYCAMKYAKQPESRGNRKMTLVGKNMDTDAIHAYYGAFFTTDRKRFAEWRHTKWQVIRDKSWEQLATLYPSVKFVDNKVDTKDDSANNPMEEDDRDHDDIATTAFDDELAMSDAINNLSEAVWYIEDRNVANRRLRNKEQFSLVTYPPWGRVESAPRRLYYFIADVVGLWSSHFFQNKDKLGGKKEAYSSGGRVFFRRGGDPTPVPYSTLEPPVSVKQAVELSVYGIWGGGRLPPPPEEVVYTNDKSWDFGNFREAKTHVALVENLNKCSSLQGLAIAAQIAKLTPEYPNDSNYGQDCFIDSFVENEILAWNKHRRNGAAEAKRELLTLKVAVDAARLMTIETMINECPKALIHWCNEMGMSNHANDMMDRMILAHRQITEL